MMVGKEQQEIAILGGGGLVGQASIEALNKNFDSIIAPLSDQVDILDPQALVQWMRSIHAPVIYNLVAYTNVDQAEKEKNKAFELNAIGAQNVGIAARRTGKFLVHQSTDFVFPGTAKLAGPYFEELPVNFQVENLLGVYAQTKLAGEMAVASSGCKYAIVRASLPFGNPHSDKDFVKKVTSFVERGFPLVLDQTITPTYIPDLAEAVRRIGQLQRQGIYHVACKGPTNTYQVGRYLASKLGIEKEVESGNFSDISKGYAPRPQWGGLDTGYTEQILGVEFHSWQNAVDEMLSSSVM